jgi:mannosylglycoprotein endo-beta-mannosidase
MYDYYLDPNACLYGLHNGSAPLHIMYNPTDGMVMVANNTFKGYTNMMLVVKTYDMAGKENLVSQVFADVTPTTTKRYFSIKRELTSAAKDNGAFVDLEILDHNQKCISQNIYWVPNEKGEYTGLQKMPASQVQVSAKQLVPGKIQATLTNPANAPLAFFNRLSLVNAHTNQRLLPVFYSDNYVSVLPGETKTVVMDYDAAQYPDKPSVSISGWNLTQQTVQIQ